MSRGYGWWNLESDSTWSEELQDANEREESKELDFFCRGDVEQEADEPSAVQIEEIAVERERTMSKGAAVCLTLSIGSLAVALGMMIYFCSNLLF